MIDLITGRPENRAGRVQADRVDGTKAIAQLNREHRYEHGDDEGHTRQRYEHPREYGQSPEDFEQRDYPCGRRRKGSANLLQQFPELVRPSAPFRHTMRHETVSDD